MSTEAVPATTTPAAAPAATTTPAQTIETPPPYSALRAALGIAKKPEAKPPEKKEEPKETPKEVAKEAPKETPKAEVKPVEPDPEPDTKKVKRVPKPAQVVKVEGAQELREAAKDLRKAVQETRTPAAPPAAKLELPEDIDVEELQALEELLPDKFKGLEEKARTFWGKGGVEEQYIAKWENENPGQTFDPDAPEHATFYKKNEPFVTDAERAKAQRHIGAKMARRQAEEAAKKITTPVQMEMAQERAAKVADPLVKNFEAQLFNEAVELADPELKGAKLEALAEEHPLLHGIVSEVRGTVQPALKALFELKNGAPFNGENQIHAALLDVAHALEAQVLARPDEERAQPIKRGSEIVGYKPFVTMAQFQRLPAAERENVWRVNEDTIIEALQNDVRGAIASKYKAKVEEITKYGGAVKRKVTPAKGDSGAGKQPETPAEPDTETTSVEASSTAPTPTSKPGSDGDGKNSHPYLRKALGLV